MPDSHDEEGPLPLLLQRSSEGRWQVETLLKETTLESRAHEVLIVGVNAAYLSAVKTFHPRPESQEELLIVAVHGRVLSRKGSCLSQGLVVEFRRRFTICLGDKVISADGPCPGEHASRILASKGGHKSKNLPRTTLRTDGTLWDGRPVMVRFRGSPYPAYSRWKVPDGGRGLD